jgi:hypothetical protein
MQDASLTPPDSDPETLDGQNFGSYSVSAEGCGLWVKKLWGTGTGVRGHTKLEATTLRRVLNERNARPALMILDAFLVRFARNLQSGCLYSDDL